MHLPEGIVEGLSRHSKDAEAADPHQRQRQVQQRQHLAEAAQHPHSPQPRGQVSLMHSTGLRQSRRLDGHSAGSGLLLVSHEEDRRALLAARTTTVATVRCE